MRYTIRKQTKSDFTARLRRVEPGLAGRGPGAADTTIRRPVFWSLAGFGWCYIVISIASRRDQIRDSLTQGSLSVQTHEAILGGLAALLAVSGVMLGLHLLRILGKVGARKSNSGNLLFGVLAAATLVHTPPGVFQAGFGVLDTKSRSILLAAHASVKQSVGSIDWGGAVMVASNGR